MRTDSHTRLASETDRLPHHCGVAGVKAARDVGGCDAAHHVRVSAHSIGAEGFAHVAIQVDEHDR